MQWITIHCTAGFCLREPANSSRFIYNVAWMVRNHLVDNPILGFNSACQFQDSLLGYYMQNTFYFEWKRKKIAPCI